MAEPAAIDKIDTNLMQIFSVICPTLFTSSFHPMCQIF